MAVIASLLLASITYCVGRKQGAMDERLSINAQALKENAGKVSKDSVATDSLRKTTQIVTTYRDRVREKVVVQHDTILVHDSVVAVSPEVSQLIQADDPTIAALKNFVVAQDTLIADLRQSVALRDTRIELLEKAQNPGKLRKTITAAKWLATGIVVGLAVSHR